MPTGAVQPDAQALAASAARHMGAGAYSDAADAWTAALRSVPSDANLHSGLADALGALGQAGRAEASYLRAIELQARHGHAYVGLGELAMQRPQRRRGEAINWLQHGVALQPSSASAWLLLGAAQNEEAQDYADGSAALLDKAVVSLRTAARFGPRDPTVHWQLGDVLTARGERQLGVLSLATAVRLQPGHVEAYSSLARILSYEALSPLARRLAAWAFRRALRAAPQHLETWHNLGEYLHAQGEPAGAVVAFSRATRIAPTSGASFLTLGESLQRLCKLDEAFEAYTRASALMPRSARATVHALLSRTSSASASASTAIEGASGAEAEAAEPPPKRPLPLASELRVEMADGDSWRTEAVRVLNLHGVVVVAGVLPRAETDALHAQIDVWPVNAEGTSASTRQPHRRRHQALPMFRNASGVAVRSLRDRLDDVLARALGTLAVRYVECGYLTSEPGAQAQALHADTAPAKMRACEAATLKVQLALVQVTGDMGPLEVVPGSHLRHSSSEGNNSVAAEADEPVLALPILVRPGDVTIYWSSLKHRGGANADAAGSVRPTFHMAAIGEGGAPTGMPYTVLVDDLVAMYGSN